MVRKNTSRVICNLCWLLAAAFTPGVARAQGYVPEWLYHVEFGAEDQQVGVAFGDDGPPAGPKDLAAGPDGTLYLADRVNHCVKAFDAAGRLLMRTERDLLRVNHAAILPSDDVPVMHAEPLFNVNAIAVEQATGSVYALWSASLNLLSKFAADGSHLWTINTFEALPRGLGSAGLPSVAPGGNVCLGRGRRSLAVLDGADGRFHGVLEGNYCTETGRTYSVMRVAPGDLYGSRVVVRNTQGLPMADYILQPVPPQFSLFAGVELGGRGTLDAHDYMYRVARAKSPVPLPLSPTLTAYTDIVVTRYSPAGVPVAHLRFPGLPFDIPRGVAVDPAGNLYRLAFDATGMNVIRYRLLPGPFAGLQTLHELPSLALEGTPHVPLRTLAESARLPVQWDPKQGVAVVGASEDGESATEVARFRPGREGTVMHRGHLWVPDSVGPKLGVVLKRDPSARIAFVERRQETTVGRAPRRDVRLAGSG
ncbi:MAG: hypothetical protein HY321_09700 [Armatimonadetes bacterium]|nr:hypothetical protein [Armatimonadota bacterium]